MGVVRDVTVEQLAQAVGGIDTSGLAKDSTLQATNTALGNINTTLGGITTNDPPTDTTQQSIATAIINLGTVLGSDKANIDGSNIVNKTTFRQNIEVSKVSVTEVNVSGTTSANGYYVAPYDFNEYFIGGRFYIRGESGCYAIFRPSAQNKVVIMVLDDTLNRRINTPIEGKLYYLAIT